MRLIYSILVTTTVLLACNNHPGKDGRDSVSVADSPIREVYPPSHKDSAVLSKKDRYKDSVRDAPDGDLTTILNDYVAKYRNPYLIDSSFNIGDNAYRLYLKHYCLMDSAIKVPKKFIYMYHLDTFVTHNFATVIRLEKNKRTILQRKISKEDFETFLDPSLKEYGVLFSPSLRLSNGSILLDYSISIPLTDLGMGINAVVDTSGNIIFKKH